MEILKSSTVKINNKILLILLICFNVLISCKNESIKNKSNLSSFQNEKEIILKQQKFKSNNNYKGTDVNKLDLMFEKYTFKFRFIEDLTFVQLLFDGKVIENWRQINYNFSYNTSFEEAENKIKLLYNSNDMEGLLLLPGYTEELPILISYSFNKKELNFYSNLKISKKDLQKIPFEILYKELELGEFTAVKKAEMFDVYFEDSAGNKLNFEHFRQDKLLSKEEAKVNVNKIKVFENINIKKPVNINNNLFLKNGIYNVMDDIGEFNISLNVEDDSIIYTEVGNMGKVYNEYIFSIDKIANNKINLKYAKTLNGFTGDVGKFDFFVSTDNTSKIFLTSNYFKKKFGKDNMVIAK